MLEAFVGNPCRDFTFPQMYLFSIFINKLDFATDKITPPRTRKCLAPHEH